MAGLVHYTCPHCSRGVSGYELDMALSQHESAPPPDPGDGYFMCRHVACPTCHRVRVTLVRVFLAPGGAREIPHQVWPIGSTRSPVPTEVPGPFRSDYEEASAVLPLSANASAALSRRCLQRLLREHMGVKPGNLSNEIQQVLDSRTLPSSIAESVDAIRNVGNLAAHPVSSQTTGEIVEVEAHEAEWNLDVLDLLFDFVFVQPAKAKAKRAALDKKLADAGKPPMK